MLALLSFAIVACFFDQLTKRLVSTRLAGPLGGRFLHIREVRHHERIYRRTDFRAALVVIWCTAAFAAVWLHQSGFYLQSQVAQAGVGSAVGGAAGNLLDILRRQHVVDFIDLGWWPVFNLADVAIVGGLLLAFTSMVTHL